MVVSQAVQYSCPNATVECLIELVYLRVSINTSNPGLPDLRQELTRHALAQSICFQQMLILHHGSINRRSSL